MSDVVDDGLVEDLTLRAEAAEARVAELAAASANLLMAVEAIYPPEVFERGDTTKAKALVAARDGLRAALAAAPEVEADPCDDCNGCDNTLTQVTECPIGTDSESDPES